MEEWRDIKGYEGLYQVSDLGNVRSLDRRVVNHRSSSTRLCKGQLFSPFDNGNGYLVVSLSMGRKRKNHYVHRLVAEAFIDNPDNKPVINHLDYNTHNNNVTNLEWCTQVENVAHSIVNMRKPRSKCKPSNTGEKYISRRVKNGVVRYRAWDQRSFKTLEEAIAYRDGVIANGRQYYSSR